MKNSILIILSLLMVSLMIFGCVPKVSEQEAFSKIDSLPPEQLEGAMAEEGKSIAGQAYAADPLFASTKEIVQEVKWLKCVDSDGGNNPDTFGAVTVSYNYMGKESFRTYRDYCNGNNLMEYYCVGNKFGKSQTVCENGCEQPASAAEARCKPKVCGDSKIDVGEECDGLNLDQKTCLDLSFDRGEVLCAADCKFDTSKCSKCGDKVIEIGAENCDDGNTASGDGCSANCFIETGWTCSGLPSKCSQPVETYCGDGIVGGSEKCDDGNNFDDDGCSRTCLISPAWVCSGQPSICKKVGAFCGDGGINQESEKCDDGNTAMGDGCTANCQVDRGYYCTEQPSVCKKRCLGKPAGILAWWSGDNTVNSLINGFSLSSGNAEYGTGFVGGGSFSFDGATTNLKAPGLSSLDFRDDSFSFVAWIKADGHKAGSVLFAKCPVSGCNAGADDSAVFEFADNGSLGFILENGELTLGSQKITDGYWHLVALTNTVGEGADFETNMVRIYVDEFLDVSRIVAKPTGPANSAPLAIGGHPAVGFYDGLMDEVLVFNRALSTEEISSIYHASSAGVCQS